MLAGSVVLVGAAEKVCCKDGKMVQAKDAASCKKAGGKMVAKDKCKAGKTKSVR